MQEYNFIVSDTDSVSRLDVYLVEHLTKSGVALSRAAVQKLIHEGNVLLNGAPLKPHHKIKSQESIKVIIPPAPVSTIEPQDIPLKVVYEDDDLIVVNKPRAMVVHPAAGNSSGTLVNALLFHCPTLSNVSPDRPGIVHRLDKDTAGLMVAAKNNSAHLYLAKQFAEHSIKRIYAALVLGRVEFDEGVVDLPIGRHPVDWEKMAVDFKEGARQAFTRYRVIKRYKEWTHVELTPQTGRTHQLRVHMAALGHPIIGDTTYGRKDSRVRFALYAKYLGFIHPKTEKFIDFEHALPEDMQKILDTSGVAEGLPGGGEVR